MTYILYNSILLSVNNIYRRYIMTNDKKDDINIENIYGNLCTICKEDFIKNFKVKDSGLNNNEVYEKLHKFGPNEVTQTKPKKWYN